MVVTRKTFILFISLAIFCLLPFSVWLHYVWPSAPTNIILWREFIVFILPLIFIFLYHGSINRNIFNLYILFLVLFAIPVVHTVVQSKLPVPILSMAILQYFVTPMLVLFFLCLSKKEIYSVLQTVKIGLIVGGGGLIFDFITNYSISRGLERAGIYNVETQISLIPRATFLYGGAGIAATIIVLMLYLLLLEKALIPASYKEKGSKIMLNSILLLSSIFGIFVTFSRIGFLYLALFSIFIIFYFYKDIYKHVFYSAIIIVISLFSVSHFLEADGQIYFKERIYSIVASEKISEDLVQGRTDRWRTGIKDIPDNFITGRSIGTGNPRVRGQGHEITHYENTFLWVINESGIIGFAIIFLPYFLPFVLILKSQLTIKSKILLIYLLAIAAMASFINPGGVAYVNVAIYSLALSMYWKFLPRSPKAIKLVSKSLCNSLNKISVPIASSSCSHLGLQSPKKSKR